MNKVALKIYGSMIVAFALPYMVEKAIVGIENSTFMEQRRIRKEMAKKYHIVKARYHVVKDKKRIKRFSFYF